MLDGIEEDREREVTGVRFTELRIDGFKSFADPVRLRILPGLTGVVGPNGCGKSNVTESLRWALGETSSKRLRGDGMDQMIFGGSQKRSPRNWCEVSLVLDNSTRNAPHAMNEADVISVVRRIDRGSGSGYRVNGRPARLKDLQILFKDNATGPSSGSIIGQSRVSDLMRSKPEERRFVLEEAAGVTGILQRKREAENDLRASEENLGRADEAHSSTTTRVATLRRQAKQVERLRAVENEIRELRLRLGVHAFAKATGALSQSRATFDANEKRVAEAILDGNAKTREQDVRARAVPALQAERTAAEVQVANARTALAALEDERRRLEVARTDLATRRRETERDLLGLDESDAVHRARMEERSAEREALTSARAEEPAAIEAASEASEAAMDARVDAEKAFDAFQQSTSHRLAVRSAAEGRRKREVELLSSCEQRLSAARVDLARAVEQLGRTVDPAALDEEMELLAGEEVALGEQLQALEEERAALADSLEVARASRTETATRASALRSEERTLSTGGSREGRRNPCRVPRGLEKAVAAAVGSAIGYPSTPSEDGWWAAAGDDAPQAIPGTVSLTDLVEHPAWLGTAMRAVFLCDDDDRFEFLAQTLPRGSRLVTRDGRVADWTGLRRSGGDPVLEADMLRQARLEELATLLVEADEAALTASVLFESRSATLATLVDGIAQVGRRAKEVRETLAARQRERMAVETERQKATIAAATRTQDVERLAEERATRLAEIEVCDAQILESAETAEDGDTRERIRRAVEDARRTASESAVLLDRLVGEQRVRQRSLDAAIRDIAESERALAASGARREELRRRLVEMEEIAARTGDDASFEERLAVARELLEDASALAVEKTEASVQADRLREEADAALRTAIALHASLLESRERFRESISRAQVDLARAQTHLVEDLGAGLPCEEDGNLDGLELQFDEVGPLEVKLGELDRQRVSIGAVNHLAESELQEFEARLGVIEKARTETVEAIRTLRKAIVDIEGEARRRLEPTFERIDENFGLLFRRIFNGGEARLRLVGDDILTAGLEVFIAPPGKLMQSLSLFSGGERALSSIALIFSAFLVNPSPICILDEADSDLDEANVVRLYDLVRYMSKGDATRFVVITHKPVAMAKMDRLYGVTMQEGGVSMLTGVDLDKAVELIPGVGLA